MLVKREGGVPNCRVYTTAPVAGSTALSRPVYPMLQTYPAAMRGELAAPDTVQATVNWFAETSTALSDAEHGTNTREPSTAALPYGDPPMLTVASAVLM